MNDADLCALKKFNCKDEQGAQITGNICLCTQTLDGGCVDRTGCLIFCAYWNKERQQYESDHKPSPISMGRTINGMEGNRRDGSGVKGVSCDLVQPVVMNDPERSKGCVGIADEPAGGGTIIIANDEPNNIETRNYTTTFNEEACPYWCIHVVNIGDQVTCFWVIDNKTGHIETTSTDRLQICLAEGNDMDISVTLVREPGAGPSSITADIELTGNANGQSDFAGCGTVLDAGDPVNVINTKGSYIPKNKIVTFGRDRCCNNAIMEGPSLPKSLVCPCSDLGFSIATLFFPPGTVSQSPGQPDQCPSQPCPQPWPPFPDNQVATCECLECDKWNGRIELEEHRSNGRASGEGKCTYARTAECYSEVPLAECGPYGLPCAGPLDNTSIVLEASCLSDPGAAKCDPTAMIFDIVNLTIKIRGCTHITYTFPPPPRIPVEGDICQTAIMVQSAPNAAGLPFFDPCRHNMGTGSPSGPGRCTERTWDFVQDTATGELTTKDGLSYTYPDPGPTELWGVHDINGCFWRTSAATMPTICLRRSP